MFYERMKIKKIIQAVSYLLSLNDSKMNYTKLLKLFYIIDREAINNWDRPITNDDYVSMPNGPNLSKLYDLIRGRGSDFEQCEWNIHFFNNEYDLINRAESTYDELTEAEMELIAKKDKEFKKFSWKKMLDFVHDPKNIPEYRDPGGSATPILFEDILKQLGRSEEEINQIIKNRKVYEKEHEFLINECS